MKTYNPYHESKLIDPTEHPIGTYWGTLDGQYVLLINMRYSHLLNVRRHILEFQRGTMFMIPYIEAEIKHREQIRLARKYKAGRILYGKKDSLQNKGM